MEFINEEDLQNTVLTAPIGICILNADTLVVEMLNDKFLEVAGKPREAIIGHWYWEPFAEAQTFYEAALSGVVSSGEPFYANEVALMLVRGGREEHVFVTFVYAPVKDVAGTVRKVAVWVLENTQQVNEREKIAAAKAALQGERDRLREFFMQAPAGICILSGTDLVFELVNPFYQQLFPGRDLLGKPLLDAVPEVRGAAIWDILQDVYRTGKTFEGNELLIPLARTQDGPVEDRYFNFIYQARRDESGYTDGIVVFVTEVTGMIKVQHELREAREWSEQQTRVYETITSGTPDLIYVFDLNYRFTYANKALLCMWGKTWENSVGKSLLENGYEPWHAEMHEREIDQVKATKHPVRGEVSFPHATLGKRIYDYILTPVINEQGEVEAIAGTTRDITERKQWEDSLAQTSEELQAVNEELAAVNEEQAASNEELIVTNEELALVNGQLLAAQQAVEEGKAALRLAIDAANFGTWFIHSVTREFITDARLKELFGYFPDEDLSIEQALAQITNEYRGVVASKLENAIYNNGDYDVTYPVTGLHDNRLRWLRAIGNLKADASGAFSAFTGVVMDITEPYLAAKKVERAEESLRMATEAAGLGTYYINVIDRVFHPSPKLKEFFGFGPDEEVPYEAAIGQIHPEHRQTVADMVEAAIITGGTFDMEYPIIAHNDGGIRWVRGIGAVQQDETGVNRYFTGVLHDITDRKRAEEQQGKYTKELQTINEEMAASNEEMAASNEELATTNEELTAMQQRLEDTNQELVASATRLRMAIASTNLGTWDYNPQTGELYWSKECRDIYGIPLGRPATFASFSEHLHPDDRDWVQKAIQKAIDPEIGGGYNLSFRINRFDNGETRWVKVHGTVYFDQGQATRFIGTVLDITDIKEAEEKSAKLAAIIRSSDDAIISKTLESIITSWNTAAERIFGYQAEEMIGESIYKLIPQDRLEEEPMILARLRSGERVEHFETKRQTKEGRLIDVSLTISPIKDPRGNIIGLSKIARDITEKKLDETRKSDFIGMVSHELKTPLTSLGAIIQVTNTKLKDNEDNFLSGAMQKANQQVKRMSTMINGFLNVSRLESGKIHIDKRNFDIETLIRDVIAEANLTASTHLIHFIQCPPIKVNADRDKILSVVSNYLSNAIKYSPKGKNIEISCEAKDGHVIVSVKDEGLGINPDDLPKIFDRYYRVETSHTRHIAGFGIGLYLSSEIIERHGGRVWAESQCGVGSTFYFSLPLNK
jgi:PAS domain S-box-containing protein